MDEQQKRAVVILEGMLMFRKNQLKTLKQETLNMDLRRVKIRDEEIALNAAIVALTDEITRWVHAQ